MTDRALATIAPIYFNPGETIGEFTERFIAGTQGKPPELIALVVWRLGNRAFLDGIGEAVVDRDFGSAGGPAT
jgi:hypothetical protein